MKRCKICRDRFTPRFSTLQPVCEKPSCVLAYKKAQDELKVKKELKKMKEGLLKHSDYENILQQLINKIVRLIDQGNPCISHGGFSTPMDAGHYHSVGANNSLRFNLFNNFLQCRSCNHFKSSNRTGYDEGLKKLFGFDEWLYINEGILLKYKEVKLSIPELKEAITNCKEIVVKLQKDKTVRSADERLQMRYELNRQIGIYL